MTMYALDAHIAKSFSAGLIDYISFGIMPSLNGFETNWVKVIFIGIPMAMIYYGVFRVVIRKLDVKTPGRTDVSNNLDEITDEELTTQILLAIGGMDNIASSTACITRLRLQVKDKDKVNRDALSDLGAKGVVYVGDTGIQIIFGARAQFLSDQIESLQQQMA